MEEQKSLHELTLVKGSGRTQAWEQQFLKSFETAEIVITSEDVQMGPDGWPYLFASTNTEAQGFKDKALNVVQWAYQHGVGIVINPDKEKPDFVFNFGMVWSYMHRGEFVKLFDENYPEDAQVYIAKITDDMIPSHVQHILKDYIASAGVETPRAALITRDKLNYEIAFAIESLNNPPAHEHLGIAKGIGWFMPTDMPVVLLYEEKFQKLFEF